MILRTRLAASLLVLASLAGVAHAESSATAPALPGKVALQQKLNAQVPLDLMMRDEAGRIVRLREFFGKKPVILSFMYYRCPMLCSMVQEGMTNALTEVKFDIGREYDVVTVSIDPRDTPEGAAEKKEHYVKRYGRLSAASGWHFLTTNESSIKRLTDSVGFEYAYDPKVDQFAHGAVIMVLTPEGRVSRYLPGIEFKARDIRLALTEASQGKIGGVSEQLLLLCYHYDPATGRYGKSAMAFVRAGGIATVLALGGFIFVMIRGERKDGRTNPDSDETTAK